MPTLADFVVAGYYYYCIDGNYNNSTVIQEGLKLLPSFPLTMIYLTTTLGYELKLVNPLRKVAVVG